VAREVRVLRDQEKRGSALCLLALQGTQQGPRSTYGSLQIGRLKVWQGATKSGQAGEAFLARRMNPTPGNQGLRSRNFLTSRAAPVCWLDKGGQELSLEYWDHF
jgi:hypothetical protein